MGTWEKVTSLAPKDKTEFDVTKLKKGDDYKFRVRAENSQGLSDPLETEKATKAKDPFSKNSNTQ